MTVISFGRVGHQVGTQGELDAFNRARAARGQPEMTMAQRLRFAKIIAEWKQQELETLRSELAELKELNARDVGGNT